ncbi:embryonic protein UVS.2-like [Pelobates fuscus]|uniref:embryonic protein UVS.2-like n=1 Tax=Pelobates fuscus TaxID=191477 RepID=UPI002FE43467
MRVLVLLAALCGVCLTFPSLRLLPKKKRHTGEAPNVTEDTGVFQKLYEANRGRRSILDPRHIITHLDVAVQLGRAKLCQNGICLWPKSQDGNVYVPYKTSSSFQFMDRAYLSASFSELEGSTCVRFIPQTTETDYISFENLQGCWSSIGCVGGAQTVSLGKPKCMWTGVITHEIMHALGLHHEHVRMDRSQYINVLWQNILSDYKSNFEESFTLNLNLTSYDYGSLMHYEGTAFSIDGILPTIVAIPYNNVSFGQRSEMSQLDIVKINTLYNCNKQTYGIRDRAVNINNPIVAAIITSPTTTRTTTTATSPTTTRTTTTSPTTTRTTTTATSPTTTRTTTTATSPTTTRTTTTSPTTTRTTTTATSPTTTRTTTLSTTTRTTTTTTTKATTTPPLVVSNGCGGNVTAASAIITSPNYPKNYPSSAYCVWNITTTPPFSVTFTDFDIENAINCGFDSVKIYNGPSTNKIYLVDSYCGQTLPRQLLFYTNSIQIVLTTDDSVQNRGFRLVYQKV